MKKKILIQLFGIISYALTQLLLMLYFSNFYSLEVTSKYIYYLAVLTPLSIFCSYGLRNGVASDKHHKYHFKNYIGISYIGVFLYFLCVLIFLNLSSILDVYIFIFTMLFKMNELISEPYYGDFLRKNISYKYAFSRIYKFILGFLLFFIFYSLEFYFSIDYIGLLGYLIAIYLVFLFYDRKNADMNSMKYSKKEILSIVFCNFPLALSALIVALNSSLPKIILGHNNQGVDLAIFGFLIYINSIAILPITALVQILYGKKDLKIKKIKIYIALYSLVYVFGFLLFAPFVLKYLFNVTYGYDFNSLLLTCFLGVVQFYLMLNNFFLTYHRMFNAVLILSSISIITSFTMCILLFDYGLNGIIFSVFMSSLVSNFLSYYIKCKFFK